MPFAEGAEVIVMQIDDENWEVRSSLSYRGEAEQFTVPVGTRTDFASVPRPLVWFLPRYGRYTKAAILHDYLWRNLAATGKMSWVDADGIFRRAMQELEVPFIRRWMMWAAVRWAALVRKSGKKKWFLEAWKVLIFSAIAIPFVLPPAAAIMVSLAAFYLLELVVFGLIKMGQLIRATVSKQPPHKRATAPKLGWKTSD